MRRDARWTARRWARVLPGHGWQRRIHKRLQHDDSSETAREVRPLRLQGLPSGAYPNFHSPLFSLLWWDVLRLDGICYYIWTDIFFGDMSNGRMNQFVPQLILGNALDGSSGAPAFKPKWGMHTKWSFGAHYFFETYDASSNSTVGHAAYGEMCVAILPVLLVVLLFAEPSGNGNTE